MFAAAALLLCTAGCRDEGVGRWVDPNIGGVAPLLTTVMPQVHRPHAMVRIYPVTEPGLNDRYFSDRIYGIALLPEEIAAIEQTTTTKDQHNQ